MPVVEFVYSEMEAVSAATGSSIRGRVIGSGGPDNGLYVWLFDSQANRQEQAVTRDGVFIFEGLAAGLYSVEVVGYADVASRSDIALDGKNTVQVELAIPLPAGAKEAVEPLAGRSVIAGAAPDAAGKQVRLTDAVGNEYRQTAGADHSFRFADLDAGIYTLAVEGGYEQRDLEVDGLSGLQVTFQPLVQTWETRASPAGSMPGYSVVRVEVEGMRGLPVYIWKDDWEGMMRRTGSKPEYGECSAEFSPLGPGTYMVEPEGLGIWADVQLTGLEVVWLDFRRKAVPSSPHVVEKLPPAEEKRASPASVSTPHSSVQAVQEAAALGGLSPARWIATETPPAHSEPPPAAARDRVCALVLSAPSRVEDVRALLRHVAEGRLALIDSAEDARGDDRVLVVGDAQAGHVAAALEALRGRGVEAEARLEGLEALPF